MEKRLKIIEIAKNTSLKQLNEYIVMRIKKRKCKTTVITMEVINKICCRIYRN